MAGHKRYSEPQRNTREPLKTQGGRRKVSARKRRKRKLIIFIIEIAILALVSVALFFFSKLDLIQNKILDPSRVRVNEDLAAETQETFKGYTTIAMFGLDNRSQGQLESGNSDVIMILNINNDTKEVNMASVYRDTYLNVAGADDKPKYRKANAAYAYGGPEQAVTMLNRNLDLDIDNYVAFDFSAVADAIDILGGVDIEITSNEELKWVNEYINATNSILKRNASHLSGVGMQTMDGVQAVAYARVRYTSGGDFKRAERQRRVFSEMVKKAKKANLSQLTELIDAVFPKIQTDLTKKDMVTMATAMIGYDMANGIGFPIDRSTTDIQPAGDIVVPCDLATNVTKLHQLLFGTEDYEPSATVQGYSDTIVNNTGYTADSSTIRDEFTEEDDFIGDNPPAEEDTE